MINEKNFISVILFGLLICFMGMMQGCGGSTGWRVSFGVSPITSINDNATLKEAKDERSH